MWNGSAKGAPQAVSLTANIGRTRRFSSISFGSLMDHCLGKILGVLAADPAPDRRIHATGGQARSLYTELTRNTPIRAKPEGGALANVGEGTVDFLSLGGRQCRSWAQWLADCRDCWSGEKGAPAGQLCPPVAAAPNVREVQVCPVRPEGGRLLDERHDLGFPQFAGSGVRAPRFVRAGGPPARRSTDWQAEWVSARERAEMFGVPSRCQGTVY